MGEDSLSSSKIEVKLKKASLADYKEALRGKFNNKNSLDLQFYTCAWNNNEK